MDHNTPHTPHNPRRWRALALLVASGIAAAIAWATPAHAARGDGKIQFFDLNWGRDKLYGGSGNDLVRGAGGIDRLQGDSGRDTLRGYGAHDQLFDRSGSSDLLWGGAGRDFLLSIDTPASLEGDTVLGSTGVDECDNDPNDIPSSCEL